MDKPILIGICGGTGSGKTTVARAIFESLPASQISIIEQDAYYKEQSHLDMETRRATNYDHPLAFDTDLLIHHIDLLMEGNSIEKPIYDFSLHTRSEKTVVVPSRDIVLLEGIMIFEDRRLREKMDIKIYVDTDADIRVIRRITRDISDRGRTLESVISQYLTTVKPAHEQFIEPMRKYADLIIPEGGYNKVAIDIMVAKVRSVVRDRKQNERQEFE